MAERLEICPLSARETPPVLALLSCPSIRMAVFLPFLSSSRYLSFVVPVSALGEPPTSSHWHVCTLTANLTSAKLAVIGGFPHSFLRAAQAYFGYWGMFQVIALCGFIPGLWYLQRLVWGSNSILSWNTKAKLSPAVATSGGEAACRLPPHLW